MAGESKAKKTRNDAIVAAVNRGLTYRQIAEKLDISPQRVQQITRLRELPYREPAKRRMAPKRRTR